MKRSYTPGPWRANASLIEAPQMALIVATVAPSGIVGHAPRDTQEMRGNARLIAAAPEVFEAAKAIAEPDCYYDGNNIVIRCQSHGDAIRRMRVLRDALEKSEARR